MSCRISSSATSCLNADCAYSMTACIIQYPFNHFIKKKTILQRPVSICQNSLLWCNRGSNNKNSWFRPGRDEFASLYNYWHTNGRPGTFSLVLGFYWPSLEGNELNAYRIYILVNSAWINEDPDLPRKTNEHRVYPIRAF